MGVKDSDGTKARVTRSSEGESVLVYWLEGVYIIWLALGKNVLLINELADLWAAC